MSHLRPELGNRLQDSVELHREIREVVKHRGILLRGILPSCHDAGKVGGIEAEPVSSARAHMYGTIRFQGAQHSGKFGFGEPQVCSGMGSPFEE